MNQEELNKSCGERLRKCIKKKNLKQKDVASASNFTEQHISNIVKGNCKLTTDTARILSRVLGVRMEYLLCEDDYETTMDQTISKLENIKTISKSICAVLDCKGYRVHRDMSTEKSKPFKAITLYSNEVNELSNNQLNTLITERLEYTNEQTIIPLKHPDGRIIRISSDHFHSILYDIENYIDYKLYAEFEDTRNYAYESDMRRTNNKTPVD